MKISVALFLKYIVVFSIFLHTIANATNGYFSHGKSIIEKSQAGAGVAQISTNFGLNNNPAQLSNDVAGFSFELGTSIFSPNRDYSVLGTPSAPIGTFCGNQCPFSLGDGNQKIKSDNAIFIIPQFGMRYQLDEVSHLTLSVFANGGMNTEYRGGVAYIAPQGVVTEFSGTFGYGNTGVDLAQVFTALSYSKNLFNNTLAIGGSIFYAYQQIEMTGLMSFAGFSLSPNALSNQGASKSDGIGWRIGAQYKVTNNLTLAGTYQAKVNMSKFDEYSGLFANSGDFDIPSNWTLGFAYSLNITNEILLDFETIQYADVASVSNSVKQLFNGSCTPELQGGNGSGCLGGSNGAGFGWKDMSIIKFAYSWSYSQNIKLRAGVSYTEQPIGKSEILFAILAPAVIEKHFTLGASYQLASRNNVNVSLMYAPKNKITAENNFDSAQQISVAMSQIEFGFSYQGRW